MRLVHGMVFLDVALVAARKVLNHTVGDIAGLLRVEREPLQLICRPASDHKTRLTNAQILGARLLAHVLDELDALLEVRGRRASEIPKNKCLLLFSWRIIDDARVHVNVDLVVVLARELAAPVAHRRVAARAAHVVARRLADYTEEKTHILLK